MFLSGAVAVSKEGVDGSFCIPPDMSREQVENREGTVKDKPIMCCFFAQFFLFGWLLVCLGTQIPSEYTHVFPCSFSAMLGPFVQEAASGISDLSFSVFS